MKNMFEVTVDDDDEPIVISNVTPAAFTLVLQWINLYLKNDKQDVQFVTDVRAAKGIPGRNSAVLPSWSAKFFAGLTVQQLYALANAANFLNTEQLLSSCLRTVAYRLATAPLPPLERGDERNAKRQRVRGVMPRVL